MSAIRFAGVTKSFDRTEVLRGIDLDVADGEFVVLVGPSGCGKTTLLRILAGLEEPDQGDVFIDGRSMKNVPPKDRDVAMVFQSYALYPHMTVRDNLGFALKVRKVPRRERDERVAAVAAMLGLGELLDRRPRQLSGGQRQRVAMGRAIVRHPKAFLFDEPLSNLDAALRSQMRVELKLLHERLKATMVYVTHDQVEAMTLADRIAVLNEGRLLQVGSPKELYERPARKFVATFLGSPAMNILSAVARDGHAEGDGFSVEIPPTSSGRALLVGIRPHDVRLESGPLAAEVQVVEPVGREAYVHLRLGSATLVASCEVDRLAAVRSGAKLSIGFAPDRVHLFDAKTEERL